MIELTKEMAVIGAVNEILLDMVSKRESFREILLTPRLICSYVFMIGVRSGYLVSNGFNAQALESFFLSEKEVFQRNLNPGGSSAYRLRIEKLLSPAELVQARSAPLSHPCTVSIIAQMMSILGEDCNYPCGFLRSMKIDDSLCMRRE